MDLKIEINVMKLIYATKQVFQVRKTDNNIEKIDFSFLENYVIIIIIFYILNNLSYLQLF